MIQKTLLGITVLVSIFAATNFANAQTIITPLDSSIGLEKTIVPFSAPKNNKLPWGFVEGKIANPVEGYPVIIQIYKYGEPVHFAQTDVKKDGSYEYKFRVRDVTDGKVTRIFEGDYLVKIFKVVYLKDSASA